MFDNEKTIESGSVIFDSVAPTTEPAWYLKPEGILTDMETPVNKNGEGLFILIVNVAEFPQIVISAGEELLNVTRLPCP